MSINLMIVLDSIYNYLYTTIYIQLFIYNYLYTTIYIQLFIYNYLYNDIKIRS